MHPPNYPQPKSALLTLPLSACVLTRTCGPTRHRSRRCSHAPGCIAPGGAHTHLAQLCIAWSKAAICGHRLGDISVCEDALCIHLQDQRHMCMLCGARRDCTAAFEGCVVAVKWKELSTTPLAAVTRAPKTNSINQSINHQESAPKTDLVFEKQSEISDHAALNCLRSLYFCQKMLVLCLNNFPGLGLDIFFCKVAVVTVISKVCVSYLGFDWAASTTSNECAASPNWAHCCATRKPYRASSDSPRKLQILLKPSIISCALALFACLLLFMPRL